MKISEKFLRAKRGLDSKTNENDLSTSIFLGPHAENSDLWEETLNKVLLDYIYWRKNYYPNDGYFITVKDIEKSNEFNQTFGIQLQEMLNSLKDSIPFFSPRYLAHMQSELSLPGIIGYFATMLYNPNNVTEESSPVTTEKELEFSKRVCEMLGYNELTSWAHLCSGGTAANLEALWVSRQSQFFPLLLKDICKKNHWDFKIKLPNSKTENDLVLLKDVPDKQLLQLKPNESIYMLANLSEYLQNEKKLSLDQVIKRIEDSINKSEYNIKIKGFANVLSKVGLKPVLLVPQTAHYSLKKAANILGYGEDAIRNIPTDEYFRIDINELEKLIKELKEDEYLAGVVAIFGTTEEGAIDPIHEIKWLRDKLAEENNISFWLHVDAAWGGFFCCLKNIHFKESNKLSHLKKEEFEKFILDYINEINIEDDYLIHFDEDIINHKTGKVKKRHYEKKKHAEWGDLQVFSAMFALSNADSITVDPHKMGYIPYPAGLIAFKNKRITYLLEQQATYIGTDNEYIQNKGEEKEFITNYYSTNNNFEIPQIGAYTLEGSRPGASAMACWFSSEVIPLDIYNHGKLIKNTVLNAKKFAQYLQQHRKATFNYIDKKVQRSANLPQCDSPFVIELLSNSIDTNLVCFFVRPAKWERDYEKKLKKNLLPKMEIDYDWTLEDLNKLNKKVAEKLTVLKSNPSDSRKTTLFQKFYIGHTNVSSERYSAQSLKKILKRLNIDPKEYETYGIDILRSTVMNPWYFQNSNSSDTDFFMIFLEELHLATREAMNEIYEEKLVDHFKKKNNI